MGGEHEGLGIRKRERREKRGEENRRIEGKKKDGEMERKRN